MTAAVRRLGCASALVFAALASLPSAGLAGSVANDPVQSYDSYKSWLLACDNTLTCVAKGFAEDGDERAEISITRAAGPTGAIKMAIGSEAPFALSNLLLDGAPLPLSANAWKLDSTSDETTATSSNPAAIQAALRALGNGTALTLGSKDAHVSLAGLRAALLRMDVLQGRVGTVTALARPGSAAASYVAAPPALPSAPRHLATTPLTPADERALIARVRVAARPALAAEECDAPADLGSFEAEAHALDTTHALVLLPCLMGAYQGSALAFVAPRSGRGPVTRLILPTPYRGTPADDQTATMVTSPDFDDKTGKLTMFAKGRGLTDCGLSASWVWDGTRFVLSAMAMQQACGGLEAGDWPTLYRTAEQRR